MEYSKMASLNAHKDRMKDMTYCSLQVHTHLKFLALAFDGFILSTSVDRE